MGVQDAKAALAAAETELANAEKARAVLESRSRDLSSDIERAIEDAFLAAPADLDEAGRKELRLRARASVTGPVRGELEDAVRAVIHAKHERDRLAALLKHERLAGAERVKTWVLSQPVQQYGQRPYMGFEGDTCCVYADRVTYAELKKLTELLGHEDVAVAARGYEDPNIAIEFDVGED